MTQAADTSATTLLRLSSGSRISSVMSQYPPSEIALRAVTGGQSHRMTGERTPGLKGLPTWT